MLLGSRVIFDIGTQIGYFTNILFIIIMAVGCVYCMKKYLN
jgi:hypothetical protein